MLKNSAILLILFISTKLMAGPVLQMNRAFTALSELIPFLTEKEKFMEKKNDPIIAARITELQAAFKAAKHDTLIKEDLFAPSYVLINENIAGSLKAFKQGEKEHSLWLLKEVTTHCLDCHTRMPTSHPSSFQNGDMTIDQSKFENSYNLGIAQLIVRRYVDAKTSFIRSIDEKLIKKEITDLILPFKQLLLIETKVLKNPGNMILELSKYIERKDLPEEVRRTTTEWMKRLKYWKGRKVLSNGLRSDDEISTFIQKELIPLRKNALYDDGYDVDLLIASGLLSNYLFENPTSSKAPDISFWLGWSEKHLKRENFFGSGDLFLKQCIKRYPTLPIAGQCLEEYKESVNFTFSGSSGTDIPADVQKELEDLAKLIKKK